VREADFEHEINPLRREPFTLEAGRDFDVAILAAPPPVQKLVCAPLRDASTSYGDMLAGARTVVTQAIQLWLDRTPAALGQGFSSNSLMSMYVEPIDTYCDMSHLLVAERWPKRMAVRHIAYFCGVFPVREDDFPAVPPDMTPGVKEFLERDVSRIWPAVAPRPGRPGFDWNRLVAPRQTLGPARLASQYLRLNHQRSERYVLTPAGTVSTRLWPAQRCFSNLVLAGDWTRNGFDAGCVEGAISSGILAAQAISPALCRRPVLGRDGPPGFPNGPRPPIAAQPLDATPAAVAAAAVDGADRVGELVASALKRLRDLLPRL
jgi:hypothetical protein